MKHTINQIKHFWPIYLVAFLAFIGISLPLPVLTPILLEEHSIFFEMGTLLETKKFYLGLVLAAYPLGEFIGSPILGKLSDKFGRKKIIFIGQMGTTFGYILTAFFISQGQLYALILARFLTGLFEGTISTAHAYLADHSTAIQRSRLFGMMTTAISIGYVTGPIVGGVFSNSDLVSFFNSSTPFYAVAFFSFITGFIGLNFLKEKKKTLNGSVKNETSLWNDIQGLLESLPYRNTLIIGTLATMGLTLFVEFFSGHLNQAFKWNTNKLSYFWIYLSAVWAISSLFAHIGERYFSLSKRIAISYFMAGAFILISPYLSQYSMLLAVAPIALGLSIGGTNTSVLISNLLHDKKQGLGQGLRSSTRVLADAMILTIGGQLFSFNFALPFLLGGSMLIAAAMFFFNFRTNTSKESLAVASTSVA